MSANSTAASGSPGGAPLGLHDTTNRADADTTT